MYSGPEKNLMSQSIIRKLHVWNGSLTDKGELSTKKGTLKVEILVEYYTFHSLILSSSDLRGWANSRDIIFVLYPFS